MPNAVTASPVKAMPADAPVASSAATSDPAAADFAALLLGQLVSAPAGTEAIKLETADTADAATTDASATAATDPSLLLAEIGFNGAVPVPLESDRKGAPMLAEERRSAVPDPLLATSGKNTALTGDAVEAATNTALPAVGTTALPTTEPAAKLAAFDQKLAEALPAVTPPQPITESAPLQNIQPAHAPQAAHAPTENIRIDTPVRDQAWSADFGQKVVWMATQDKQSAQITLNPPQLGPIEISLSVKNDQATAAFASPHAEVREAIESALPRLREMLAGVGVELGQANVNAESFRQAQDQQAQRRPETRGNGNDTFGGSIGRIPTAAIPGMKRGNGLVDTFA